VYPRNGMLPPIEGPSPAWRALRTECVAAGPIDLDIQAGLPLSRRAAEAGQRYFAERFAAGGRARAGVPPEVARLPSRAGRLLHADAADVRLVAGADAALDLLARGVARAHVILMADDRPGVGDPFARHGHALTHVPSAADGTIATADLDRALRRDTRLVVTSSVLSSTGVRQPADALASWCRVRGVPLVVEAAPSAGLLEPPAAACPDVVVMGVAGGGGAMLRRPAFAAAWPATEPPPPGEGDLAGLMALDGAFDVLDECGGAAAVEARVHALVDYLHARLDAASLPVRSPRARDQRANITIVGVRDPAATAAALAHAGIRAGRSPLGLRVGLHAFTLDTELDTLVDALVRLERGDVLLPPADPPARRACVDLNGVLDEYRGWRGPRHWDPPRPGAGAFLRGLRERGWHVTVFTTRYYRDAWAWLLQHGLADLVDEVTDRKPPADVFVDDRALRFRGDYEDLLDEMDAFRPHWDPPAPG
jgi:selenocysteine lyase/cysteine desulfurase